MSKKYVVTLRTLVEVNAPSPKDAADIAYDFICLAAGVSMTDDVKLSQDGVLWMDVFEADQLVTPQVD